MRRAACVVSLVCLVSPFARADDGTAHRLAGARAFRAQRYDEALVEFRDAERARSNPLLGLYLGPTLYKLGRYAEARAVLAQMRRRGTRDAVAEYYLGLT